MANRRITDVDFVDSLDSSESFFINKNNAIKQINRTNIVFDVSNGGTGSGDGAEGLANLLASGATILSEYQYGDELPDSGTPGQLFFLRLIE